MPAAAPDSAPLILTAGDALARTLRTQHALAQRDAGRRAWETPAIHSLRRWCLDQWLQAWPTAQLLHPVQELILWQQAIEADRASAALLSPGALAREARSSGRLVLQYRLDPAACPQYTDEHAAFARWHRRVKAELRERDWVMEAELPARVATLLREGRLAAPPRIRLVLRAAPPTPQEQDLLQALAAAGSVIEAAPAAAPRAQVRAWRHADDAQQFHALALALREHLLPCLDGRRPPPELLVLCPDPEARREQIEAALRPLLAPWLLLPDAGPRPQPWRFAAGRPLDQQPLVALALAVCELDEHDNRLERLSRVLLASALWSGEQRELAARTDYRLRDAGGTRFGFGSLLAALPAGLQPRFDALREALRAEPRRALPSAWAQHFEQRLAALGWPGERALSSEAFQACADWRQALASFGALDAQCGRIGRAQAAGWLREMAAAQAFAPRSEHDQPVQILSLQEGAGIPADAVFVLDATDDRLPAPARRYPLLAGEALAAAGVPGVTAAGALEQGRLLAAALRAQTGELQLSHAALDERGAECAPTPLFGTELEWRTATPATTGGVERAARHSPLYWPESDPVPPVGDPVAAGIFGGARLFRDYAEAPFFAFCKYRLGIQPLPEPPAGIPARAQGNIIHAVLERFWRKLGDSGALQALTPEQLGLRLDEPLDAALARELPAERFGRQVRQIERARLRDLLLQWLRHEQRRPEPFAVIECEQRLELEFAGLRLKLVIDRMDRVQTALGERHLILDYKTGREAEVRGWKADRLQEPQLPLYATGAAQGRLPVRQVDGIAFAHVKDGHPALAAATNWGMGLIDDRRRFRVESWPAQLAEWEAALARMAQGFLAGDAALGDPAAYRFSVNRDLLDLVREPPPQAPA